jgi:peptidoglycan/LPS O-acetylase OafA/YrhL
VPERTYRRRVQTPVASRPSAGTRPRSRLAALDLLRFLAAFAVVAFHYTSRTNTAFGTDVSRVFPQLGQVTALGALGVQLFFMISGFVILKSIWGRSTQDFVASRVSRLFPAYWCALVVTAAVMLLVRPEPVNQKLTLSEALTNLTMVQTAFGVRNVDGVYWTLYVELKFYLLIALFALVGLTRNRIIAFAMLWPVAGAVAHDKGEVFLSTVLASEHAVFFATGMLLYLIHREGHSAFLWGLVVLQWALAMQSCRSYLLPFLEAGTDRTLSLSWVELAVTVIFAAVALATVSPLSRLSVRWMSLLGALTYPLYLVHENWGYIVIHATHGALGQLPALALAVVGSLAAAYAIHRLVERPLAPRLGDLVRRGLQSGAPEAPRTATLPVPAPRPTAVRPPVPTSPAVEAQAPRVPSSV